MGKSIKQLTGGDQLPGMYSLEWDGTNSVGKKVPQGIYFCKFIAGEDQETVKLVVLER
jgi:flagellar hook assembly protein FlgD